MDSPGFQAARNWWALLPSVAMEHVDPANIVLAVCAVLGLIVTVVSVAYGYGAFRGRSLAAAQNAKEATARMFEHINDLDQRLSAIEKLAISTRLDRAERVGDRNSIALVEAELLMPSDTQAGSEGRGVRNPLRPR